MEIATKIAPIALALIMFGLGLGLTVSDFLRLVKISKDFFVGIISQIIIMRCHFDINISLSQFVSICLRIKSRD